MGQSADMVDVSKVIALIDEFRERAITEAQMKKAVAISVLEERMIRSYTSRAEGGRDGR